MSFFFCFHSRMKKKWMYSYCHQVNFIAIALKMHFFFAFETHFLRLTRLLARRIVGVNGMQLLNNTTLHYRKFLIIRISFRKLYIQFFFNVLKRLPYTTVCPRVVLLRLSYELYQSHWSLIILLPLNISSN